MSEPPSDAAMPPLHRFIREAPLLLSRPFWFGSARRIAAGRDGRGRSVMVIPGFLAGDFLTVRMRHTIDAAGYRAHGWGLGYNRGATADLLDRLSARLDRIEAPVSLVGWSLGGLYARELAKRRPDRIDRVITLGTPFSGDPRANRAWRLYELINDHPVDRPPITIDRAAKPPVPTFAIWSPIDGIVAPASSRGLPGEADVRIKVRCRHMGFVSSPQALRAVLDALEA